MWELVFRTALLAAATILYIADREKLDFSVMQRLNVGGALLCLVWAALVVGMLHRLIPNKRIAMGARKHYAGSSSDVIFASSVPVNTRTARKRLHKGALSSAVALIALNAAVFLILSLLDMLTPAAAFVIMLVYAVCDLLCILFFCPFRALFMRNRCCTVCRIYNWDYLMMCTPMVLFPSVYSISLLLVSAAVLIRWEIAVRKTPQFFIEDSNENLCCINCKDMVCRLRRQGTQK